MTRRYCDCRICMYHKRPFAAGECLHMESCPTLTHADPSDEAQEYVASDEFQANLRDQESEPLYPMPKSLGEVLGVDNG